MDTFRLVVVSAASPSDVAERWRQQYPAGDCAPDKEAIYRRLIALKKPTVEAVERIIGNQSWTNVLCDVCIQYRRSAVRFNDAATVCLRCLNNAKHTLSCITTPKR